MVTITEGNNTYYIEHTTRRQSDSYKFDEWLSDVVPIIKTIVGARKSTSFSEGKWSFINADELVSFIRFLRLNKPNIFKCVKTADPDIQSLLKELV